LFTPSLALYQTFEDDLAFTEMSRDDPDQGIEMAWILLALAGIFEIVWAYAMKQSDGFSRLMPTVATIGFMIVSFGLLAVAMRTLPLGTAYAVWTGIGAVGSLAVGIFVLGEPATFLRVASAGLILAGIVGLKLSS
jgi:quaternary ammonium compound-resistance protein SugE